MYWLLLLLSRLLLLVSLLPPLLLPRRENIFTMERLRYEIDEFKRKNICCNFKIKLQTVKMFSRQPTEKFPFREATRLLLEPLLSHRRLDSCRHATSCDWNFRLIPKSSIYRKNRAKTT